jgi:uncharacterized protein (TIGR02646 family)
MRRIDQQPEPTAYAEWRAASQADINYGYDLIPGKLRGQVKAALIAEQGGICAYTGIEINLDRSHIEHLIPQAHCVQGVSDVAYSNMAACYPGPDGAYVPFGAVFKANWPPPAEQHLFVSPFSSNCEARFSFSIRGKISVAPADEAARVTVERLGLDNKRLERLRLKHAVFEGIGSGQLRGEQLQ